MTIEAGDRRLINFEIYGGNTGESVLLIHGLGADLSSWKLQVEKLTSEGYRLICPDMYGHGKSGALTKAELGEWNDQLLNILNHLKLDRVHICGVSMGGVIALNMASENPERLLSITVSDSFCELRTPSEKILGASQILGFRIFKLLGRRVFASAMAAAYKQEFAREAREYMYRMSLAADFDQLLTARKAINKVNLLDRLRKLNLPALVVVGNCFGKSFVDSNRKIADALPGCGFAVLENAMDPSPMTNAEAFNSRLLAFLKS